ncbi:uncharacterized protein [Cherax quadricarinatus]|uniref:uncharacterized protein n=1 Tax=Cherax quadricarinatus TaxID=27406 RepID=UPI00387EAA1B
MSEVPALKYVVLGPADLDDVMTLLNKYFFPRESTYMIVGATTATRSDEEDTEKCLESGVSVGSREQTTGRLVGVCLSYIITSNSSWYNDEAKCSTQAEVTMARILNTAKSRVDLFQDPTVKRVQYMVMSCVHPDYGRRGVCKKLGQIEDEQLGRLANMADDSLGVVEEIEVNAEIHREASSELEMDAECVNRKRAATYSDSDDTLTPAQRPGKKPWVDVVRGSTKGDDAHHKDGRPLSSSATTMNHMRYVPCAIFP